MIKWNFLQKFIYALNISLMECVFNYFEYGLDFELERQLLLRA